jgi:hypothetical protein
MVLFDIKLVQKEDASNNLSSLRLPTAQGHNTYNDKSYMPSFEPDIAKVVTFGTIHHYMRQKTQLLIMQNYEKVKQAMLANESTWNSIFEQKLGGDKSRQS